MNLTCGCESGNHCYCERPGIAKQRSSVEAPWSDKNIETFQMEGRVVLTGQAASSFFKDMADLKKLKKLYHSTNALVCTVGAEGQIDARHEAVGNVMDALHAIDAGTWDNNF